jgi:hypothetical protein
MSCKIEEIRYYFEAWEYDHIKIKKW